MTTIVPYPPLFSDQGEQFIYDEAPKLVYWEATQACALSCTHCRAESVPYRNPFELMTAEAEALFRQIADFGGNPLPHLVITGGDPLERPDLFELIAYGRKLGLSISITPAGTGKLTSAIVGRLREAGISSIALSLDGSTPDIHDGFRGVSGSFEWTMAGASAVVNADIPLQINTLVSAQTLADIPYIYDCIKPIGVTRWALFFLISTGRGEGLAEVTPAESESLLNWLGEKARHPETPFIIKTTEAHHYRRIAVQKMRRHLSDAAILQTPVGRGFGIRDGNGIVFVSHRGQVFPSGFLPLSAGNVRKQSLVDIYRNSDLFRSLRDVNQLKGKCGICPYRTVCGGSRARAYAVSGDPMASDPLCPYQPRSAH